MLAVQGRHLNFRAEGGLWERDGHHTVNILAVAFEERMLFGVQHDVEIAWRAAVEAGLAFAGVQNARAFLDARRNVYLHRALARDASLASTLVAGIDDELARTLAGAAGARDGEETLLITHLPAPAAGGAVDGRLAGSDTTS